MNKIFWATDDEEELSDRDLIKVLRELKYHRQGNLIKDASGAIVGRIGNKIEEDTPNLCGEFTSIDRDNASYDEY